MQLHGLVCSAFKNLEILKEAKVKLILQDNVSERYQWSINSVGLMESVQIS